MQKQKGKQLFHDKVFFHIFPRLIQKGENVQSLTQNVDGNPQFKIINRPFEGLTPEITSIFHNFPLIPFKNEAIRYQEFIDFETESLNPKKFQDLEVTSTQNIHISRIH